MLRNREIVRVGRRRPRAEGAAPVPAAAKGVFAGFSLAPAPAPATAAGSAQAPLFGAAPATQPPVSQMGWTAAAAFERPPAQPTAAAPAQGDLFKQTATSAVTAGPQTANEPPARVAAALVTPAPAPKAAGPTGAALDEYFASLNKSFVEWVMQ